jgi:hypothetical protein
MVTCLAFTSASQLYLVHGDDGRRHRTEQNADEPETASAAMS